MHVYTAEYLIYCYDTDGKQVYWTFTGDDVCTSLSLQDKKDFYLVSTADGAIRFYKSEACLGEVYLRESCEHLVSLNESWLFGFGTRNCFGVFDKTTLVWEQFDSHEITCLSLCVLLVLYIKLF